MGVVVGDVRRWCAAFTCAKGATTLIAKGEVAGRLLGGFLVGSFQCGESFETIGFVAQCLHDLGAGTLPLLTSMFMIQARVSWTLVIGGVEVRVSNPLS